MEGQYWPLSSRPAPSGLLVERLQLEWRTGTLIPEPTGRLVFRPADDHNQLIALMTAAMDGTLEAHGRAELTRISPGRPR